MSALGEEAQGLRNIVLVGDIAGEKDFHVGDEAMLEANLRMLQRLLPAAQFTLVSLDYQASSARYACRAVPRLGLSGTLERRAEELQRIAQWVDSKAAGQALPAALAAVAEADLLVISGGGNLSSTWPEHILERLALVRMARARGIEVVILGQTLGPQLRAEDAELVGELLRTACWVGLREASSYALAVSLGVAPERLEYQMDDAIDLAPSPVPDPWAAGTGGPRLAVTLHPVFEVDDANGWLDRLAQELQAVIDACGARLVFIPHVQAWRGEKEFGDRTVGEALARRLRDPEAMRVLDVPSSAEAVWLAQQADALLSSRYHPLVFALARSKPCLGLATDRYTATKLRGALMHAGREADLLSLRGNGWPDLVERLTQVLRRPVATAEEIDHEIARLAEHRQQRETRLMARLLQRPLAANVAFDDSLLRALTFQVSDPLPAFPDPQQLVEHWQRTAEQAQLHCQAQQAALERQASEVRALQVTLDECVARAERAESYAASLEQARVHEQAGVQEIQTALAASVRRAEAAESELQRIGAGRWKIGSWNGRA